MRKCKYLFNECNPIECIMKDGIAIGEYDEFSQTVSEDDFVEHIVTIGDVLCKHRFKPGETLTVRKLDLNNNICPKCQVEMVKRKLLNENH